MLRKKKLTVPQLQMLRDASYGRACTFGSSGTRVSNTLVEMGLCTWVDAVLHLTRWGQDVLEKGGDL